MSIPVDTANIYGGGNSEMCWYAASSFESGNNLVIQYRGKRAKFMEMDRIGHAGPVTFMECLKLTDQPKGLDTMTPISSGPVSFSRGETETFTESTVHLSATKPTCTER